MLQQVFLLFPPIGHEINELRPAHAPGIKYHNDQIDHKKIADGFCGCLSGEHKGIPGDICLEQVRHCQRHQLGKPCSCQKSHRQGHHAHTCRLQPEHDSNPALTHSQGQIYGKFLFPLFQHEAAGIDDQIPQGQGNQKADAGKPCIHGVQDQRLGPADLQHGGLGLNGIENVEYPDSQHQGEKVDQIIPGTLLQILYCQTK